MWKWFGIFSKSSDDTCVQNSMLSPEGAMTISPQSVSLEDSEPEMPPERSQSSTVISPMLENVILSYGKNSRYFPFKYFKPTSQEIEEDMDFLPSCLQEQSAIQGTANQKYAELEDGLQRTDFFSSLSPYTQSSSVKHGNQPPPSPSPPPPPPHTSQQQQQQQQQQRCSQPSKPPTLSQSVPSLSNHPPLSASKSECSIPLSNALCAGSSRRKAAVCAPRFMMKVLEALRELRTKECCCRGGSTANEIADYIAKNYVVDGDLRSQVRIALRLAHVSGLVAYIQHQGLYELASASIADMSVSKRRYQRFLRRRRDIGLFKPTPEVNYGSQAVSKKSKSKTNIQCHK